MKKWFSQLSTTRQTLLVAGGVLALIVVIGAVGGGGDSNSTSGGGGGSNSTSTVQPSTTVSKPKPAQPKGDSAAVNRNTRGYVRAVNACRLSAAIVRAAAAKGETDLVDLADLTTTARDTCDSVRTSLPGMDTEHFDDQAAQAWAGVDEIKSGLNAVLAYIDNPRPTKIIEARNKLNEGDGTAADGLRQINRRRKVYGLKALKAAS